MQRVSIAHLQSGSISSSCSHSERCFERDSLQGRVQGREKKISDRFVLARDSVASQEKFHDDPAFDDDPAFVAQGAG